MTARPGILLSLVPFFSFTLERKKVEQEAGRRVYHVTDDQGIIPHFFFPFAFSKEKGRRE